jgi:hypothetical protein
VGSFEHVCALEMLVVLERQEIEGQRLLDILFDPADKP